MQEYSKRLGPISPQQFQAALSRLRLGDFVTAEPVPFGLFGQNFFLTSTQGEFVFRGAPHYPWQFPTERFFVHQLHERTHAPVPYPYLLESSADIFGWSFVIMPRMPGVQLQDQDIAARLSFADRAALAQALAGMLVEVQQLTWAFAGQYDVELDGVKPLDQPYRAWIVERIRDKVQAAQSYNEHTTDGDVRWIESVIAQARPMLRWPYKPCAVLGDYGEHNTVALRTAEGWRISGLFDLMTAHFGDGQADLSLPVTTYLREDERLADLFVAEYLRLKPMPPSFVAQQQLYMLDLTLSFWRHWQRNEGGIPGESKDLTFQRWARPAVDYWTKFAQN